MSVAATRWEEEAKFFDQWAERAGARLQPTDPRIFDRYRASRALYAKELALRLIGDPRGKRILDVGCGDGENSVLLASLGATVTGVDVSPGSVQLAQRRAELDGLSKSTSFVCSPIETLTLGGFDVIWIDNVLHHVLPALDQTLSTLARAAKPGAIFIAIEPASLSPALRRLRLLMPVHTEVTPGERPLERADLEIVNRHVPDLGRHHFQFLARMMRFVLPGMQYESASLPRRALCDGLAALDRAVLSVPGLDALGAMAVLHGHFRT